MYQFDGYVSPFLTAAPGLQAIGNQLCQLLLTQTCGGNAADQGKVKRASRVDGETMVELQRFQNAVAQGSPLPNVQFDRVSRSKSVVSLRPTVCRRSQQQDDTQRNEAQHGAAAPAAHATQ
nr:hypothetical protein [Mesorhizobium sp. L48C026A00]